MKKVLLALALAAFFLNCKHEPAPAGTETKAGLSPDERYGELFAAVQMARVFKDSKTFADCTPKFTTDRILEKYAAEKDKPDFDLKRFVDENFEPPKSFSSGFRSDTARTIEEHINALWPVLTRQPDATSTGTLIPLKHPYVVPGGRFGEVYYWDSYFTMLGLQAAEKEDVIENMIENFAQLLDQLGMIPNGNRTYYLGRSQPPFFSLMVGLLAQMKGQEIYVKYLPQLEKEYQFWMNGMENLSPENRAYRRVVKTQDGAILNRYWDDRPGPRPESYREDVETAEKSGRPKEEVWKDLRAGAESGWDYSSRWLRDGKDLSSIHTTEILPVDLNSLLYNLEMTIAKAHELNNDTEQATLFRQRADQRAEAILRLFWDPATGVFYDFDFVKNERTRRPSLAMMYPLFFKIAREGQADSIANNLVTMQFMQPGGLLTTPVNTGQQWDAPNGWAPLQWMAINGLRNYGKGDLAQQIKIRWMDINKKVYHNTAKMVEKYNVVDMSLDAGGGEYPLQDGFGWSNGVMLRLSSEDRQEMKQ